MNKMNRNIVFIVSAMILGCSSSAEFINIGNPWSSDDYGPNVRTGYIDDIYPIVYGVGVKGGNKPNKTNN